MQPQTEMISKSLQEQQGRFTPCCTGRKPRYRQVQPDQLTTNQLKLQNLCSCAQRVGRLPEKRVTPNWLFEGYSWL